MYIKTKLDGLYCGIVSIGSKANLVADRIFNRCILIAKYNSFTSKLNDSTPHLNVFVRDVKNRFELE